MFWHKPVHYSLGKTICKVKTYVHTDVYLSLHFILNMKIICAEVLSGIWQEIKLKFITFVSSVQGFDMLFKGAHCSFGV